MYTTVGWTWWELLKLKRDSSQPCTIKCFKSPRIMVCVKRSISAFRAVLVARVTIWKWRVRSFQSTASIYSTERSELLFQPLRASLQVDADDNVWKYLALKPSGRSFFTVSGSVLLAAKCTHSVWKHEISLEKEGSEPLTIQCATVSFCFPIYFGTLVACLVSLEIIVKKEDSH